MKQKEADKPVKKTMYLVQDVIDRGEWMATARRISFSKLIAELVNENYQVANIIKKVPTASEVTTNMVPTIPIETTSTQKVDEVSDR